ncbi:hypothetical protein GC170_07000 [bacterium]|nr:hypothetical protein [bacterium]
MMNPWTRRRFVATTLGLCSTGCQFVRLGISEADSDKSVGEALKSTKSGVHPLAGPKRIGMKIAILHGPVRDSAIDRSIWNTADDQIIPADIRETLRSNGLRVGMLRSSLPLDVEDLMKKSGPAGQTVEPLLVNQPVSEPTKIATGENRPECSILMDTGGKVQGKSYKNVSGFVRISGQIETDSGVVLKVVPELHHGDVKASFASVSGENPFEPTQLALRSGQTEELLRELTFNVPIEPSHCLVIGLDATREGSLGWFLLTDPPTTDQDTRQRMILIWAWNASREISEPIASKPKSSIRFPKPAELLKPPIEAASAQATPDSERSN